ncbi:tRNA pseudouridine(55) synthase TruB [Aquisalimonas asiatica]|uniref:tRNA pseudouridine synthase B n=1 Tax=Aquisalimonas asiatica TaxID=406100 RepID=A0A1H8RWG1_9GAMM|nr:tRNA pseudouridine(55) synthase TruB [Aquisalimonas asiatica]SEO70695.1 tRNA pseudouridine synthase B [Aquisalimonas asiatica]
MAAKRHRRNVNGILLLDKPGGGTSNKVLQRVKYVYQARKAGHTGSLDPLATGLLPLCFGEATKVSGFLLDADKRYRVTCLLGATTTTADAEGEVVEERPVPDLGTVDWPALLQGLTGEQDQVPPMYSAVKHQGERLYRLARRGEEVERKARRITIHALDFVERSGASVTLDVHCSKGTYVRTLAESLGEALGTGAHVTALRRTALGPFDGHPMVTMDDVEAAAEQGVDALDALLLPPETGLRDWPAVTLDADSAHFLRQGQAVFVPRAPGSGWVQVFGPDRFLGMGVVLDDGRIAPRRLMAT